MLLNNKRSPKRFQWRIYDYVGSLRKIITHTVHEINLNNNFKKKK